MAIAGWGPQEPQLRRLADELGVQDSFRFLGRIAPDEVASVLATYDAYFVPTRQAGFDNTALEGVYMDLPSVVSQHSGLGEALADGEEVLVVPPDEKSMSEAMLRLIGDPDLRARLASSGRLKVQEKLTIESYAEKNRAVV